MNEDSSLTSQSALAKVPKTAVLLINLGTPDQPNTLSVKRYLKEFLSDSRVVEIPSLLWQPILRLIILPFRSKKAAQKYKSIWSAEGSPLKVYTARQTQALANLLKINGYQITVEYAMRYGSPLINSVLKHLKNTGVERILLLPLYPQYAASTTATAFDAVNAYLAKMRNQPEVRFIKHYADHPLYINALVQHIKKYWEKKGQPNFLNGDRLLLSFHGLPKRCITKGDPYYFDCEQTASLLRQALNLSEKECLFCFQSRFGYEEWLQPYTASTLAELGAAGVARVDVFCPGFAADCLETLEEIAMEVRANFLLAGGKQFNFIPCVNDSADWIQFLGELTAQHLQGWIAPPKYNEVF